MVRPSHRLQFSRFDATTRLVGRREKLFFEKVNGGEKYTAVDDLVELHKRNSSLIESLWIFRLVSLLE